MSLQCSGMLDPDLLLWLLVPLQGSVKLYFPLFPFSVWSVLQTHAQSVCTLTFTHNAKSSHVCHTCSITLSFMLTHSTSSSSQTHFTQQGHSQFPLCSEEWLFRGRGRERTSCLSALHLRLWGSESFGLSGIAMATYYTFVILQSILKLSLS